MASSAVLDGPRGVESSGIPDPMDATAEDWVLFLVGDQTYALGIWEVERIVRAFEVSPLLEAPPYVLGMANIQGRVLPAIDLRLRFGRPSREIRPEDHFIIARTSTLSVVIPVDAALGSQRVSTEQTLDRREEESLSVRRVVTLDSRVVCALNLEHVVFGEGGPAVSEMTRLFGESTQHDQRDSA